MSFASLGIAALYFLDPGKRVTMLGGHVGGGGLMVRRTLFVNKEGVDWSSRVKGQHLKEPHLFLPLGAIICCSRLELTRMFTREEVQFDIRLQYNG
jgi:hypothetical protein